MKGRIVGAALCAALGLGMVNASSAQGVGTSCGDTRASEVPVDIDIGGVLLSCGGSISIDGITILTGSTCAQTVVITPAHQKCEGVPLLGSYCVPQGTVAVQIHHFECRAEYWLLGIFGATIRCTPSLRDGLPYITNAGHVEDFQTLPCRTLRVGSDGTDG